MADVKTSWTHMVRLSSQLPATRDEYHTFDGRVVYTKVDRDGVLRAVVSTNLARKGEAVAYWDSTVQGRGAFVYEDGTIADVTWKQAQPANKVKPHVTTSWATDTREGRLVCLPYRVKWHADGSTEVQELAFKEAVVVRYK